MPLVGRILLRGLSPDVVLRGIDGEAFVDQVGTLYVLRGLFQLVIAGQSSPVEPPLIFDGRVGISPHVVHEGDDWVLDRSRRQQVVFDPVLEFQPNRRGPWLRASLAEFYQNGEAPRVTLVNPEISLLPAQSYRGRRTFYYPVASGRPAKAELRSVLRDGITGFYIEHQNGKLVLAFGGVIPLLSEPYIDIDHVPGVTVSVFPEGTASFRCGATGVDVELPPLRFDARGMRRGIRVTLKDASGLQLDEPHIPPNTNESWLQVDELVAGSGWLSALTFRRPELTLLRLESIADDASVQSPTRLFGPASRFAFHLPLIQAGQDGWAAHFAYRNPDVFQPFDPQGVSRSEPYYGLHLRGLGSSKGGQVRLDASLARVALLPDPTDGSISVDGKVFCFQSGGALSLAGRTETSVLVPKPNRAEDWKRSFEIPANQMSVRVAVDGVTPGMQSPILLDTALADLQLKFVAPRLVGRPAGASSARPTERGFHVRDGEPVDELDYARWSLSLEEDQTSLNFRVRDGQIYPVVCRGDQLVEWSRVFRTDPADPFPLADYPGAKIQLDPQDERPRALEVDKTELAHSESWQPASGRELMVYSAISAVLIYKAIDCIATSLETCIPDTSIKVKDVNLEEPSSTNPAKRNGLNDLLLVYYNDDAGIRRFIDNNATRRNDTQRVLWPFAAGLSLLMWERTGNRYAPAIARTRKRGAKPGLAIDWSDVEAITPSEFGWTEAEIADFARLDPTLWPRRNRETGARLDPSDRFWRGILLRDLPLVLPLPPAALQELDKLPLLKSLLDAINDSLMLEYGWKDESGTTWKGGVVFSPPKEIVPLGWTSVISIQLTHFLSTGSENAFISAEGGVKVSFPRIIVDDDGNRPLSVSGKVSFSFSGTTPTTRVVVESSQGFLRTTSIPGFDKIKIVRFFTDFRSAQGDLELLPSPELAAAIPIFTAGKPLRATISYNFSGDPAVELSFILPEKEETNLFRKWDVRIKGMKMRFEENSLNRVELGCELVLGQGSFGFVGLDILLRKTDEDDWAMTVQPREVAGRLGVGDFELTGALSWTDEAANEGEVSKAELQEAGDQRDFWGLLRLKGGEVFGDFDFDLWVRFGNRGGQTYWAGGIYLDELPLGIAKLKSLNFVLSRDADLFDDRLQQPNGDRGGFVIQHALNDLGTDVVKLLRPERGAERTWLARWRPQPNIGSLVVCSGYLSFDEDLFSSPESDDSSGGSETKQYLTTLMYTNRGFVRIEAAAKILKTVVARFGIAIRPPTGFGASFLLPSLKYPSEQQPDFEFSGGQIILEVDYGDDKHFLLSMGWPPLTGANPNDELERDWSKSLMVRWDDVVPINTFWGGFRAEYREGVELSARRNMISLGVALRAGWTKSYELGGDAAGGQAELGIAVGGLVEFKYTYGLAGPLAATRSLVHLDAARSLRSLVVHVQSSEKMSHGDLLAAEYAIRRIELALERIAAVGELDFQATLFADVWGKGSATVLGVEVAAIKIEGRARIHVKGSSACRPIVYSAYAYLGFDIEVKIGCETLSARGRVDFVFIDRPCRSVSSRFLPGQADSLPQLSSPFPGGDLG